MGDTTIATDIKAGIADMLADLGHSVTIRNRVEGVNYIDSTPSKGKEITNFDYATLVIVTDFEEESINNTSIQRGDRIAIISLDDLDFQPGVGQVEGDGDDNFIPAQGNIMIDSSVYWKIVNVKKPEMAGITVVVEAQIRK